MLNLIEVVYNATESCEDRDEEDIFKCICQLKYGKNIFICKFCE